MAIRLAEPVLPYSIVPPLLYPRSEHLLSYWLTNLLVLT